MAALHGVPRKYRTANLPIGSNSQKIGVYRERGFGALPSLSGYQMTNNKLYAWGQSNNLSS